jgi:hypothetical protein
VTRPTAVDVDDHVPEQEAPALDETSARWLSLLRAPGAERDPAIQELHALLLRAAHFEIPRRPRPCPRATTTTWRCRRPTMR